jgi:hypothetical protein
MMECKLFRIRGIAILEASGALLVIFTLLISSFGLVEYMRISRNLGDLIDKYVYESAFKPYVINSEFNGQTAGTINLNKQGLEKYIDKISLNIGSDLESYLTHVTNNTQSGFIIESAYTELPINPDSGEFVVLAQNLPVYSTFSGNTSLTGLLNKEIKLEDNFQSYATKTISTGKGAAVRSYYAIPNAGYNIKSSSSNFLPSTVLVGVRAGVSLENTFIGGVLALLGRDAFLSEFKIVTLRGEISDEI